MLDLCRKSNFIVGETPQNIKLGVLGSLLSDNLRNEWIYNNVTNREVNIFLNTDAHLCDTYSFARNLCENDLPFGIAEIKPTEKVFEKIETNLTSELFNKSNQTTLKTHFFVPPTNSDQIFYNWQNQCRIWWRKISALPSRYSLTDIQTKDDGVQSVEIIVTYPWGAHILETVTLDSSGHSELNKDQLLVKNGRKKAVAHCITNTTYLFTMTLNALCDAYDVTPNQDVVRPVLRFHRKIAPYKISFSISNSDPNNLNDLNDLALFLCKKLRKDKISCIFIPNPDRTWDLQCLQFDELGIPYTLVLEDDTLKTGIAHLRSRDTTLREQIHVSNVQEYVGQLLKNF